MLTLTPTAPSQHTPSGANQSLSMRIGTVRFTGISTQTQSQSRRWIRTTTRRLCKESHTDLNPTPNRQISPLLTFGTVFRSSHLLQTTLRGMDPYRARRTLPSLRQISPTMLVTVCNHRLGLGHSGKADSTTSHYSRLAHGCTPAKRREETRFFSQTR